MDEPGGLLRMRLRFLQAPWVRVRLDARRKTLVSPHGSVRCLCAQHFSSCEELNHYA